MAALDPAVAAIRVAVRTALAVPGHGGWALRAGGREKRRLALAACSGGADSLALAAALAFVAPRAGWRAGLVTVDHQLQPGSAERADAVATWAGKAELDPVVVSPISVAGRPGGPEAAARDARYQALAAAARGHGADCVLLGHTREDQAETVLLAVLRGSGLRGLAGMPVRREMHGVTFVRPLLDVSRDQTRQACRALGLEPWQDPHNTDPAYGRSRARAELVSLVDSLGPAVVPNLARTARLAAEDAEVLDDLAVRARVAAQTPDGALQVADLAALPEALRSRVLHGWARWLGVPGSALSHRHVEVMAALVTDWHGQGAGYLPGGFAVTREQGLIVARRHADRDAGSNRP